MFAASKSGKAVAVTPAIPDTYFPYVSLLTETTSVNGQQNNTFLDSSSNNFSITRAGTPTQGSVTPYWPNGYWSNYFDGTTGTLLTTPTNTAFQLTTSNFTIEFWAFTTNAAAANTSFCRTDTGGAIYNGMILGYSNGTNLQWYATSTGSGWDIFNAQTICSLASILNKWTHFAFVRNGSTFTAYVNGTSTLTTTSSASIYQAANGFRIGAANPTDTTVFGGYLSNFRYVKGTAVYTGNFTPSTSPLTAVTNTQLLTCQSNRFLDNSTNGFAFTVSGTPSTVAFQPFSPPASYTTAAYGGSGYFNGSTDYLSVADNAALQLGTGDFTIEGWFYISGATSTAYNLISKGAAATGWSLNTTTSARIQFSYSALNVTGATTTLVQKSWYHIAVVRSGSASGNLKIYLNGVQEIASVGAVNDDFSQTSTMYISASRIATLPLNGYSSNVRVVKGTAIYTGAFTPPTLAPLTTSGSTSAASYSNTTNVNTSFASSATSLLTNFTNAGVYDAAVQNPLSTLGAAQSSTAIYKWSPSSIKVDGTTSTCVTFVDSLNGPTDLNTATSINAWTIECWLYYTAGGKVVSKGGNPGNTSPSYDFSVSGGTGTFTLAGAAGTIALPGYTITYPASSIPTSTWVYWAATRTTAGIISTYINGVWQGSSGASVPVYNINNYQFSLGATATDYGIGTLLTGYIQDFRITKGIARYSGSGSFTPPSAAFPTK